MLNYLLIVEGICVCFISCLFLRHKTSFLYICIHSLFNLSLFMTYTVIVYYYTLYNEYSNIVIISFIVMLLIEVVYIYKKPSDLFNGIVSTYNSVLIPTVINTIYIVTLKATQFMNYKIQLIIMVSILLGYILYQLILKLLPLNIRSYQEYFMFGLVFILLFPVSQIDSTTQIGSEISISSNKNVLVEDNLLLTEFDSLELEISYNSGEILYTDKYIYYVEGTSELKTLYKYDIQNKSKVAILNTGDIYNGAQKYIDISIYDDYTYILTNLGLYLLDNDSLLELYVREFSENIVENQDFYNALYSDTIYDQTEQESVPILYYITENDRFIVSGDTLVLDNDDYDPDFFLHSIYTDLSYTDMYKISIDLNLYNIIVTQGIVYYENDYTSSSLSYTSNSYDVLLEFSPWRFKLYSYNSLEPDIIAVGDNNYNVDYYSYYDIVYDDDYIFDSSIIYSNLYTFSNTNKYYLDLDNDINRMLDINDNYYILTVDIENENNDYLSYKITTYSFEKTEITLNYYLCTTLSNSSYFLMYFLLFMPLITKSKKFFIK